MIPKLSRLGFLKTPSPGEPFKVECTSMKWLRRNTGWIAGAVVGGFIFWGIGTAVTLNATRVQSAGEIFGRKISLQEYSQAVAAVTRQAILTHGEKFRQEVSSDDLETQAWERILLLKEAKNRHVRANDPEVVEALQKSTLFQKNGQFDRGTYEIIIRYTLGSTARTFEEDVRQSLTLGKLIDKVFEKIAVTPEELKREFKKQGESIQISFLTLPDEKTAQEIAQVTRDNPKELDRIARVWKLKLKISDFFKRTSQIPGLGNGSSFEPAFALEPGQITGPLYTPQGWGVVRLEKKEPPKEKDFEGAKAGIEKGLLNGKKLTAYLTWYQDLRKRAAPKRYPLPSTARP